MILIADSGSTKTHWTLMAANGHSTDFNTSGINPVHQTEQQILHALDAELLPQLGPMLWAGTITKVFFYGAGCTKEKAPILQAQLMALFPKAEAFVASDMLGAARGLLQHEKGIACILGTGSGAAYYDGTQIAAATPSLGYILGDEGSGATLGIRLVNALLKDPAYADLKEEFLSVHVLTVAEIIEVVYRRTNANRILAAWSHFCAEHITDERISRLVRLHLEEFVVKNIIPLTQQLPEPVAVSFIGGIAYQYEPMLRDAIDAHGLTIGRIMRDPVAGLKQFHKSDVEPTQE